MKSFTILLFFLTFAAQLLLLIAQETTTAGTTSTTEPIIPTCIFGVKNISFILFTREYPNGLEIPEDEYDNIPFEPNKITVFLVHGFASEANNSNFNDLSKTWLQQADVNIFALDWKQAACQSSISLLEYAAYPEGISNVKEVGQYLCNFTLFLTLKYNVKLTDILLVGHSLGAQVCSFAGKDLYAKINKKYSMIIGLDPAGPGFNGRSCDQKLCKSDAHFVEAFHTTFTLGMHENAGDDDFFFNGGFLQPGCGANVSCSHSRSVTYFTESLLPDCKFVGVKWDRPFGKVRGVDSCTRENCSIAGLEAVKYPARGTFYVKTADSEPFCTKVISSTADKS